MRQKATKKEVEKRIQDLLDTLEAYEGEDIYYVLNYVDTPVGRGRTLILSVIDEMYTKEENHEHQED